MYIYIYISYTQKPHSRFNSLSRNVHENPPVCKLFRASLTSTG